MSSRRSLRAILPVFMAVLIVLGIAALVFHPGESPAGSVTPSDLRSSFEFDTRNLVYTWDSEDTRSEAERRQAV